MTEQTSGDLKSGALNYHREPRPGKLEIQPTKPLGNQRDLALPIRRVLLPYRRRSAIIRRMPHSILRGPILWP